MLVRNKIFLIILIFYALSQLSGFCQDVAISELLNIRAENNSVLLDIAKKYPEVKFSQIKDSNKILIELVNAKYHQSFHYDIPVQYALVGGLDFINDVAISESDKEPRKVALLLTLKEGVSVKPKIEFTKNNVVKIIFLPIEVKAKEEKKISPEEETSNWYNLAVEEQSKGNLEHAEKLYKDVISRDKDFYLARLNLVKIYIDKQMYDQSISDLTGLLKDFETLSPDVLDKSKLYLVRNALGTVYYLKGDFDKALEEFRAILATDPKFYQAYYNSALVLEKKSEKKNSLTEAKQALKKTIELKPDFPDAYFHLGLLELITKNKKDAVIGFKKVLELSPGTKIAELSQKELDKLENVKKK